MDSLIDLRLSKGWTLREAAAGSLNHGQLWAIERGKAMPRPSTMRLLAKRYQVPVAEIYRLSRAARDRFLAEQRERGGRPAPEKRDAPA